MGPEGTAQYRRLPAHGGQRRAEGLGALRLREDARLPLGHLPRARRGRSARSTSARTRASRRGRRCPASTARTCAASSSRRATPSPRRSSSSATSASPALRSTTCATCSRSTSRKAGTCGRWSTCCTRTSAATAARRRKRCSQRRSGDADNPRILGAFNEPTPDWLAFFMFTFFTDRDGKFQLCSLAESGFDPLARTCRFMLTEEAHHMFVGESGIGRIVQRTCEAMIAHKTDDAGEAARAGRDRSADDPALPQLPFQRHDGPVRLGCVVQRRDVLHDRAQGAVRRNEDRRRPSAQRRDVSGAGNPRRQRSSTSEAPALNALNEKLRDDFIRDAAAGIERWNKVIEKQGIPLRLKAPHKAFHRTHRTAGRRADRSRTATSSPPRSGRRSRASGCRARPTAPSSRR